MTKLYYTIYSIIHRTILHELSCECRKQSHSMRMDVRSVLEVSESTLYPVLRRLQKDECLEAYNMEYAGRNRKYYKLTDKGAAQLNLYRSEWEIYSSKITRMFEEGV